jgi:hypothetical protein
MKVPIESASPADKVFVLSTPAHMLQKLAWEVAKLRETIAEPPEKIAYMHAPAYIAFNCAVTAWHIADWAWQTADAEQRTWMLEKWSIPRGQKEFTALQIALMRRYRVLRSAVRSPPARSTGWSSDTLIPT